jgi:hypothetical protein
LGIKLVSVAKQRSFILSSGERGRKPPCPSGEVASGDSLFGYFSWHHGPPNSGT